AGECSQWPPRSTGAPKVCVSVTARPPIWVLASMMRKLARAASSLRAAARPAAPAPMMMTSNMNLSRSNDARHDVATLLRVVGNADRSAGDQWRDQYKNAPIGE